MTITALDYETEYNNRRRVPEHVEINERWALLAAAYRLAGDSRMNQPYGKRERQRYDIFYAANVRLPSGAGYEVEVVSPVSTVCGWTGLRLLADRSFRAVRGDIDTLIVSGIDEPDDARRDPELIRWLARTAPRVRRVVGLCTGTFVLAEAGLLDGRRATTHWMDCDELARRFPAVAVERDPIYVRDRGVCTGAAGCFS